MTVALSDTQRLALSRRRDELSAACRPSDGKRLRVAISAVAGMMPAPGTDQGDPDAVVDAFCACFADLPAWAAEEACVAAFRGKVGATGARFRPTPGEIHIFAENMVARLAREKLEIERVLNARLEKPRQNPEERAAAAARVRSMIDRTLVKNAVPKNEKAILDAGGLIDDFGMRKPASDLCARDPDRIKQEAEENLARLQQEPWTPSVSQHLQERLQQRHNGGPR